MLLSEFSSSASSKQVLVCFPGRFQPAHKGHKMVYDYLCNMFGADNVFITTSDKVESPDSPLNFVEKKAILTAIGIPEDHVIQTAQPYRPVELSGQYDPSNTVLIMAVSEKDQQGENPRFDFKPTKDGSPSYYQPASFTLREQSSICERVYHGTPFRWRGEEGFPHGRPRLDKIGIGEGEQAYGWGWYSAEAKQVANLYKHSTPEVWGAEKPLRTFFGREIDPDSPAYHASSLVINGDRTLQGVRKEVRGWIDEVINDPNRKKELEWFRGVLDALNQATKKSDFKQLPSNTLYEIIIPDDVKDKILLWDKPYSEQSKFVAGSLPKLIGKYGKYLQSSLKNNDLGSMIYDQMCAMFVHEDGMEYNAARKLASLSLAEVGIVGTKYLDGDSRVLLKGTYNYVIWDQPTLDRVKIVKINNKVVEDHQPDLFKHELSTSLPDTINVDGYECQTRNSLGNFIHPTTRGIINFWRWFGDSCTVDEEGKPIVMFHGTKNPPMVFSPSRTGKGSTILGSYEIERHGTFATPAPNLAAEFATQGGKDEGANIMALYLKINNCLDTIDGSYSDGMWHTVEKTAESIGWDGYRTARQFGNMFSWNAWQLFDSDDGHDAGEWIKFLKLLGYDGARIREDGGESYVVFDGTQVKSVMGNRGTFSGENITEEVSFEDENTAVYSGQSNFTLRANENGKTLGYVDYVIYRDEVSVHYIFVNPKHRRKGIASDLAKELQRRHPDKEIDFGGLTNDGSSWHRVLPKRVVKNTQYEELMTELSKIKQKLARYSAMADAFHKIERPTEEQRAKLNSAVADWNELYDREYELEELLYKMKPEHVFVATECKQNVLEYSEKPTFKKPKTDAFKTWHRGSRVRKPVFHMSRSSDDFEAFDIDRSDLGIHFGTVDQANYRHHLLNQPSYTRSPFVTPTRMIPVWLSIQNPLRLVDYGSFNANAIAQQLVRKGIIDKEFAKEMDKQITADWKKTKMYNGLIRKAITDAGYDSVVYKNNHEGYGDSYIIFDPAQAKSIIGNKGTYSKESAKLSEEVEVDNYGNNVVFNDGVCRITIDDVTDARYVVLWAKNIELVRTWTKIGWLSTTKRTLDGKKILSVDSVEISKPKFKGRGYGKKMYQLLMKYAAQDVDGIGSYLPQRSNKKQVPHIYKSLSAKQHPTDPDWEIIPITRQQIEESMGYPVLPFGLQTLQQMLARGASGYLTRAFERYIPIDKLEGLEPTPAASDEEGYRPGRVIETPIEVVYEPDEDRYYVYAGNHRVTQAKLNGDTYIRAWVRPGRNGNVGKSATTNPKVAMLSEDMDVSAFKTMDQHGYILTVPTFEFDLGGETVNSATEFRDRIRNATPHEKVKLVKSLYGNAAAKVWKIIRKI